MTLKFTPPQSQRYLYATFVDTQYGPSFRVHSNLGAAKQSLYYQTGLNWAYGSAKETKWDGKVLRNIEGEWYVLHDVPAGTKRDELPWIKEVTRYSYGGEPRKTKKAVPLDREEYADWRIAVDRERRAEELRQNPSVTVTTSGYPSVGGGGMATL